ncbi:LRR receptor-like serine/threonine-protein kinase [Artemisia annua]|uniref:LRR receptor-like serine/threonine-protein kinase n=1 Tax=Artemisia annua TaxID=35608 RepID=A0A2U1LCP8_ARTAN|nr:LRR receptor-like serine/threonine-protein kinase [Artemisia annua]
MMMVRVLVLMVMGMFFINVMGQLPSQDILALLEFKKGIKHDPTGFVLSSWNEESIDFNGCPSSWNGIMCNGGNVAGVVLDHLSLSADVDLNVFANLTKLVKLSISNNSISGKFPTKIGEMVAFFDVSNNLFNSSLPDDVGKVGSLRNLSLAGNNFSGAIPDWVSGLSSIQSLDLSRNSFSGVIPLGFTSLSNLVYLNLSVNRFSKKIPKGFENMGVLEVLDLHGNMLDGDFDPQFLLLTTAIHVDLSGNLLTSSSGPDGKFLPGISETVKYLNLSRNQLTGSLVSGGVAQMFGSLLVLDLSYNQFSGELPSFNFAYDLQVLKLSNNKFSGFIPNDLLKGDSLVLTELDLSGNNLTGSLSMIMSTTLQVLNMSSNGLTGELPLVTGGCVVLDLSNNRFAGNLTKLVKWGNLEHLDLSQNQLTGSFPEVTGQFLRLNHLNLSHNSLGSSVPKVVTRFPRLSVLDLGFNQFDGPFPNGLISMPTLQELHLQSNKLSGSIDLFPSSFVSNVSNIRVLDISDNQLDGDFPDEFSLLTGLQVIDISGNKFSGSLPLSLSVLTGLVSLDISQNRFTGPLLKNLTNDLTSFNASYNDLSGVVPENLRKFPESSFFPGNSDLQFPNPPAGSNDHGSSSKKKSIKTIFKVLIIVACVIAVVILILLAIFIHYMRISRRPLPEEVGTKDVRRRPTAVGSGGGTVVSAGDIVTSRKGSSSDMITSEKIGSGAVASFSPSKHSGFSYSPDSGESYTVENLSRLDVRSPDRLAGELYFLDDTVSFSPEELSRAPAEVLGRSSHGTSYRATLDNGLLLTVKWLREGVAKQRKDFAKEAKKFANIRHPNVVGLRGYYWGPTQHEKLILSDYISPGSLASFLYDRPGRKGPPLTWAQRLKIAVDIARGLNYLHFDRAIPHGNLKSTNILLDGADLNARVADYCLHRLMTQAGTIEQILDAGVLGYRAPELAASKRPLPSFKSDIYAFGVILLELLTGKCAGDVVSSEDGGGVDLNDWVRLKVAEGHGADCFDSVLITEMGTPAADKGMKDVLGIALRCIRPLSERPGIKTVYEDLSSI